MRSAGMPAVRPTSTSGSAPGHEPLTAQLYLPCDEHSEDDIASAAEAELLLTRRRPTAARPCSTASRSTRSQPGRQRRHSPTLVPRPDGRSPPATWTRSAGRAPGSREGLLPAAFARRTVAPPAAPRGEVRPRIRLGLHLERRAAGPACRAAPLPHLPGARDRPPPDRWGFACSARTGPAGPMSRRGGLAPASESVHDGHCPDVSAYTTPRPQRDSDATHHSATRGRRLQP